MNHHITLNIAIERRLEELELDRTRLSDEDRSFIDEFVLFIVVVIASKLDHLDFVSILQLRNYPRFLFSFLIRHSAYNCRSR